MVKENKLSELHYKIRDISYCINVSGGKIRPMDIVSKIVKIESNSYFANIGDNTINQVRDKLFVQVSYKKEIFRVLYFSDCAIVTETL